MGAGASAERRQAANETPKQTPHEPDTLEFAAKLRKVRNTLGRQNFSAQQCRQALEAAGGNAELAITLAFENKFDELREDQQHGQDGRGAAEDDGAGLGRHDPESGGVVEPSAPTLAVLPSQDEDSGVAGESKHSVNTINTPKAHVSTPEIEVPAGLISFNMDTIVAATNEWSNSQLLGRGGFGVVYRATITTPSKSLEDSRFPVAVKRLSNNTLQGEAEFKNEMEMLCRLRHPNIVRLYGYALSPSEKCLVYALMENESLEIKMIESNLTWPERLNIAVGAARGLNFLHSQAGLNCAHRDIKSANILLDANMNARIGDFGIMRIWPGRAKENEAQSQLEGNTTTHVTTMHLKGTWGYIDPSYARSGRLSPKSDVFSFGVVLLEILTGRKAIDTNYEPRDLVSQVEDMLHQVSHVHNIMDKRIVDSWPISNAMKFADLCSKCVEPRARRRISVADMLEEMETICLEIGSNNACNQTGGGGEAGSDGWPTTCERKQNSDSGLNLNCAADERAALWEKLLLEQGQDIGLGREYGFECPITAELMHDPVIADDGHSYERVAIE